MKVNGFSSKKHRRVSIVVIIAISVFFFNCADLYISAWNCTEDGGYECKQYGDTSFLVEKPMDILIVLDNSSSAQELNSQIVINLNQFLKCIEPVDWRVGVVSGIENEEVEFFGNLINLEMQGQVSTQNFVSMNTKNYKKVFSDTISLSSGCDYPPYCEEGSHKPLSAVKSFMQKKEGGFDGFLRGYAPLAVIIVSTSDETDGLFSDMETSSKEALEVIYSEYDEKNFIGLTVTDAENKDDCITTTGEYISSGIDFLTDAGMVYGLVTFEPVTMVASQVISHFSGEMSVLDDEEIPEIVKFAKIAGGSAFDICKPAFGKALAYSVLQKMNMEDRFPDECGQIKRKQKSNSRSAENNK